MRGQFGTKKALGLLLFLTSCTVSLPRSRQEESILPSPCMESCVEKSLKTPFFCRGDWPEACWWKLFNSTQLDVLIGEALANNPSIQQIERRIEYAKQEAIVTRSRLFPLIYFDAKDSWEYLSKNGLYRALNPKIPLSANLIDLTLSFKYDFDFWGKNQNLFYAALGREKASEAEAAQVELITSTAVAQAYFALKANLLRRKYYKKLYAVRKSLLDLQKLLFEKALSSQLIPLQSEENFGEAEKLLASIEEEIATQQHLLAILLGRSPCDCIVMDDQFPKLPECLAIPCDLSLDLLAHRPDLMAQIWRVTALGYEVGAAIADFFPNINIRAFIGLESISYSKLFQSGSKTIGIEPALHLPIFTAGAIQANVNAQLALFDEAVFLYNELLLKSAQEVADILALGESIFKQKQEQDKIIKSIKKRYEIIALRSQKGLDSLIGNYSVEEEVIQKELDNAVLLYNQYLAVIKLIKALGGGYYADCIPLRTCGVE